MNLDNINNKYFNDIKKGEILFKRILKLYPIKIPVPNNFEDEKKNFFNKIKKGEKYNPQFDYVLKKEFIRDFYVLRFKLSYLIHIEECECDEMMIKTLYKKKLKEISDKINYYNLWGEEKSTEFILESYGKPNMITYFKAVLFCKSNKKSKKNVSLKLNDKVNSLRVINSKKLKVKLFSVGTAKSYETQVGLELYNDYINKKISNYELSYYAGLYIAGYHCLNKGFYKVYKILKKYNFSDEEAFDITFEVKKNLFDTSLKGGYVKSCLKFSGFLKVKKYAETNNIDDLMFGRISIEDLDVLKNYIKIIK
jgi:hypothetical protein